MSTLFFPAAISIDGISLTDQGREPVDVTREEKSSVVELATGKKKKYLKAVKHNFSVRFNWLPDKDSDTIDGGMGRQRMFGVLCDNADPHILRFYDRNAGWVEYVVFVSEYQETLIRRDPHTGTHFWNVSVGFEEQ